MPSRTLDNSRSDQSLTPAELALPLAWDAVRRQRNGRTSRIFTWLRPLAEGLAIADIINATDTYLDKPRAPVDLSDWVLEELPTHEAHWIDFTTDLMRAVVCLLVLRADGSISRDVAIGESLYHRREELAKAIDAVEGEAPTLGAELELADLTVRAERVRTWLSASTSEYDRRRRVRIRAASLSNQLIDEMTGALNEEVLGSFPRKLLADAGSVNWTDEEPVPNALLIIRRLERRDVFAMDSGFVEGSGRMVGEHYARAFIRSESERLASLLARGRRRTFGLSTVGDRVAAAIRHLRRIGFVPTHAFIPYSWTLVEHLWSAGLADRGPMRSNSPIGSIDGIALHTWWDGPTEILVVALPDAVSLTQFGHPPDPVRVEIKLIGPSELKELAEEGTVDVEGHPDDSPEERIRDRVILDIREYLRYEVNPAALVRIAIPEGLLEKATPQEVQETETDPS